MRTLLQLLFLPLFCVGSAWAQDSLHLQRISNEQAYIIHRVVLGDDLELLAKKYNVPITRLAGINKVGYNEGLAKGTEFKIPVASQNHRKQEQKGKTKPIYYIVQEGDNLKSISRILKINQSTIQSWNQMPDNSVHPGQRLATGWVYCDESIKAFAPEKLENITTNPTAIEKTDEETAHKLKVDSMRQRVIDSLRAEGYDPTKESRVFEEAYYQQTDGHRVSSETGAAVFYALKMRVKKGIYYAFHNTAPKGTILKITNPANNMVIYAKVLGPIPKLGEYKNALVTISNNAIGELGARDKRMFCQVEFR